MDQRSSARQRGVATLAIVSVLLLVMMVTAVALQRGLVFEHKTSTHQYRATQAQEAAEAGLEWTLARLNEGRLDAECRPSVEGRSLAERTLVEADARSGRFETAFDPARMTAPACSRGASGWQCRCPDHGRALPPPAPSDDALHPAFRVELSGDDSAPALQSVVRINALGCAHAGAVFCGDQPDGEPGRAVASVQAALLPALAALPASALTAGGDIDFGTSAVVVQNTDPRTGLLLHAGGAVLGGHAQLTAPPGTPAAMAVNELDAALAALPGDGLLQLHLGMPVTAYQRLPGVVSLRCTTDCAAQLLEAAQRGVRMLHVDGDLALQDLALGSATEPVLLVVDGALRLGTGVHIVGAVLAHSLHWQAGSGGSLRGAVVIAGNVSVQGTPALLRDAQVLETLHQHTGTYVRVPGTWKDRT